MRTTRRLFLKIGDMASMRKRFTREDLLTFSKLSNDTNPVHFDEDYVKKQGVFKGLVVHGILLGSLFSGIAGTKLPGPGSIYLNQTFKYFHKFHSNSVVFSSQHMSVKRLKRLYN